MKSRINRGTFGGYSTSMIKVVGEKELVPHYRLADDVVQVGRWFYWKDDERIRKVRSKEGFWGGWEYVYLLKNSSKIVEGFDGSFYNKDNCVKVEGMDRWEYRNSEYITNVNGKYYHHNSIVQIGDDWHPVDDEEVVVLNHKGFGLKKDCVRLSEHFYPINNNKSWHYHNTFLKGDRFNAVWVKKSRLSNLNEEDNDLVDLLNREYRTSQMNTPSPMEALDRESGIDIMPERQFGGRIRDKFLYREVYSSHDGMTTKHLVRWSDTVDHFHHHEGQWVCTPLVYSDPLSYGRSDSPVVYRVDDGNIYTNRDLVKTATISITSIGDYPELFEFSGKYNIYLYKPNMTAEEFDERYEGDRMTYSEDGLLRVKRLVQDNYAENGPDENQAEHVNIGWVRPRGGRTILDCRKRGVIMSPSSKRFGSKKYSFGVEIETSYGRLHEDDIKNLGIALVSDGSIRAGEYVTGALQGDTGFRTLEKMMHSISTNCLVSNEGAAHVHIGGAKFNRRFSILALMLAVQTERDFFLMQPTVKDPRLKYCAGISKDYGLSPKDDRQWSGDYSNIGFDNWRKVLGRYVYGVPFDKENNSLSELFRWSEQRYKWLNLINCNSNGRFETIEFRIYGVTTSFEKIYNYVLISMAFVWFVENRQQRIITAHEEFKKGGQACTLQEVVKSAYSNRPDLSDRLIDFIRERTIKFNRKDI